MLAFQQFNFSSLILLACLREDYVEGVRLKELGKRHSSNTMGSQLFYWALAVLSCGLDSSADVRSYIQKLLQISGPDVNAVKTIWIIPSVVYMLVPTNPEKAVELLAWVLSYPDTALNWVRQWPLFDRLQIQLQAVMDIDSYQMHWKKGKALTLDSIKTYLQHEFRASLDALNEASHQQLLTARESEILRLMAVGMTNPQIATQLVIGAGTVKTHTLNIYRKLDVANRTQAIVHAQELGILHS